MFRHGVVVEMNAFVDMVNGERILREFERDR